VFAGTPLVIFGECDAASAGQLRVEHDGGGFDVPVAIGKTALGETLRLLQGARLITDLEARYVEGKRNEARIDRKLEELSLAYGLASRRMALVAVVERTGDRPGELPETRVVPVGMPQDVEFASYFPGSVQAAALPIAPAAMHFARLFSAADFQASGPPLRIAAEVTHAAEVVSDDEAALPPLLELAIRIEPDGGMPGRNNEDRVLATLAALLELLAEGNTPASGPFRAHVRRLLDYLSAAEPGLDANKRRIVDRVIDRVHAGAAVPGPWSSWSDLESAIA
jgi:hypothetical protein